MGGGGVNSYRISREDPDNGVECWSSPTSLPYKVEGNMHSHWASLFISWYEDKKGMDSKQTRACASNNKDANRKKKMKCSRISGREEALSGRAGFGMPTLDHPVGGTCVAVGHPAVRTGSEPGGWGWGISPLSRAETVLSGPPAGVENVRGC